ncbi:MAG: cyclic nucleotide-binding/CBS domain-containing protein [Gammaproteobacteria bacterium]|nr:cyclic nucleotide-binding/CBS domain-containing protein [Gammaproteobacteria bacterium]
MNAELKIIFDRLAKNAPFDVVPVARLRQTAKTVYMEYFTAGEEILPTGVRNPALGIVVTGSVDIKDGEGRLFARAENGGYFGFFSLLLRRPTHHQVVAIEDCLIYRVPAEEFDLLRHEFDAFDMYFAEEHEQRLRSALTKQRNEDGLMTIFARDLIRREPLTIDQTQTVQHAAQIMREHRASSILVVENDALIGILTDRDLRSRIVADGLPYTTTVGEIMTPNPVTADVGAMGHELLLIMSRRNVHHVPVCERSRPLGMVSMTDLMQAQSSNSAFLAVQIHNQQSVEGLVKQSARISDTFIQLAQADATAEAIGHVMTSIGEAVTRRLIWLAQQSLGPAPCSYAWMSFGSQGRSEQTAKTDQDNGLIFGHDYNPIDHADYFAKLADFVCDGLDQCGYVFCPGNIMATNPELRQSLEGWKHKFTQWITTPTPEALMYISTFFDLRCIDGEESLVSALQQHVLETARPNTGFLAMLASNALQFSPPIGFFRQFVLEDNGNEGKGIDLKLRGTVPIIDIARVYALANQIDSVNTFDRLRGIDRSHGISHEMARDLIDTYEYVANVRIHHQYRLLLDNKPADNFARPSDLSQFERQHLKDAFNVIRKMQGFIAQRYGAR